MFLTTWDLNLTAVIRRNYYWATNPHFHSTWSLGMIRAELAVDIRGTEHAHRPKVYLIPPDHLNQLLYWLASALMKMFEKTGPHMEQFGGAVVTSVALSTAEPHTWLTSVEPTMNMREDDTHAYTPVPFLSLHLLIRSISCGFVSRPVIIVMTVKLETCSKGKLCSFQWGDRLWRNG